MTAASTGRRNSKLQVCLRKLALTASITATCSSARCATRTQPPHLMSPTMTWSMTGIVCQHTTESLCTMSQCEALGQQSCETNFAPSLMPRFGCCACMQRTAKCLAENPYSSHGVDTSPPPGPPSISPSTVKNKGRHFHIIYTTSHTTACWRHFTSSISEDLWRRATAALRICGGGGAVTGVDAGRCDIDRLTRRKAARAVGKEY